MGVKKAPKKGTQAKAAPRGNAESTIDGFIDLVHDIVYGLEFCIVVISDTAALSTERVDIKAERETNEFLRWVYGNLVPTEKGVTWTEPDFTTSNGVRLLASSMMKSIRGKKRRS